MCNDLFFLKTFLSGSFCISVAKVSHTPIPVERTVENFRFSCELTFHLDFIHASEFSISRHIHLIFYLETLTVLYGQA